jgi:hypothetical protein
VIALWEITVVVKTSDGERHLAETTTWTDPAKARAYFDSWTWDDLIGSDLRAPSVALTLRSSTRIDPAWGYVVFGQSEVSRLVTNPSRDDVFVL